MRLLPARFRDELHDMHSVCFKEFALLRPEHRGQSVDRHPCDPGVASRGRVRDPRDEEQEVVRSLPGGTAVVETLSHAEFSQRGHVLNSCFFADLAPRSGLQRFAGLDMALGQHIRLVLAFADESYEDVAVVQAHHHATGSNVLGDAIRSFIPARVDAHVHRSPFPVRCWEGPLPGDENSLDAMPLLLREEDVARVLEMDGFIAGVKGPFGLLGGKREITRPRRRSTTAGTTLHVMSAAIPPFHVMGLKAYTSARGATRFIGMLYNTETSELLARIEANRLGQMRTGAASAVATKHMARPDAGSVGIIGTGWQARSQVVAISRVRPVALVKCHSRNAQHRDEFAEEMVQELAAEVVPVETAADAVDGVDIVVTATTAQDPVLRGEWLRPGVHINAIGSNWADKRELDAEAVRRSDRVAVDDLEQARQECGDLIAAVDAGALAWERVAELAQVVNGTVQGRVSPREITLFESQGIALEDVATMKLAYETALAMGVGEQLEKDVKSDS